MKRKLIITTLGIASLGIHSVLVESVYSQIIKNDQLYNCYLKADERLVGQIDGRLVVDQISPDSVCNEEIFECSSDSNGCYAEPANY